jgi:hypothetical protein
VLEGSAKMAFPKSRLSLRERTSFRGAIGDIVSARRPFRFRGHHTKLTTIIRHGVSGTPEPRNPVGEGYLERKAEVATGREARPQSRTAWQKRSSDRC